MQLLLFLVALPITAALEGFFESLTIKPLPRNKALASFQLDSLLHVFPLTYTNTSAEQLSDVIMPPRHYLTFPKSIELILESTNTRELHLRFTQGWYDTESWGKLPRDGKNTGGTGVELSAIIEAGNLAEARANWLKLAQSLSGFFCALLNFVDDSLTTFPRHEISDKGTEFVTSSNNSLFLMRAALPEEPVCTENLTPFLKLLPTRGKAGLSSLLDGHKLYDSLWHSMSIDLVTECEGHQCRLKLSQNIDYIIDVTRLVRKYRLGNILKPVPGDNLRCDLDKKYDEWTCFPLTDEIVFEWDFEKIFGRTIKGACFQDENSMSLLYFDINSTAWNVRIEKEKDGSVLTYDAKPVERLLGIEEYNVRFKTTDSRIVSLVERPPVEVSRSLTGYSQDKGGVRVNIRNPLDTAVKVVYFETLPWFMRAYLYTLKKSGEGHVISQFYKPAIDRKRPGHLEVVVEIPAYSDFTFTFQFDKSLLLYAEYPPDANHGFAIAPAIVKVLNSFNQTVYQMRTTTLLLTLPTPDFSMPYNVIILTCTVMALAFGTIFNLLTKKVVTEEEFEEVAKDSKISLIRSRISAKFSVLKRN